MARGDSVPALPARSAEYVPRDLLGRLIVEGHDGIGTKVPLDRIKSVEHRKMLREFNTSVASANAFPQDA
jgi:hypothetical protein